MKIDRRATDWGLASLAVCGLFLLMAPIQLFFNDFYWSIGIHHADRREIEIARLACPLVGVAYLSLMGFGLFAGIRGFSFARSTHCPAALPLDGILLCTLDIILWIALGVNLCAILGMFM